MSYQFKTTNIKGKQYVEVNERIKYFRFAEDYKGWSISSEIIHLDAEGCVIKTTVCDADGLVKATGFAQEDKASSYINKTSFVENCETSAVGRALGMLGIGIDTSIATSNEVSMAIAKQSAPKKPVLKPMTDDIKGQMVNAVKAGKSEQVVKALVKYSVTDKVKKEILNAK